MGFLLGLLSLAIVVSLGRELLTARPGADHAERVLLDGKPKGVVAATSPILACVGVYFCLYAGLNGLLWWLDLPLSDGVNLRTIVAAVLAFYMCWIVGDRWRSLRQAGVSSREA